MMNVEEYGRYCLSIHSEENHEEVRIVNFMPVIETRIS